MPLPPTIPTSFVPHSPGTAPRTFRTDFIGVFGVIAYFILAVVMALSIGVFVYGGMLSTQKESKDAELKQAEDQISRKTAESFIRLHNRIISSESLLDNHVAFSRFFKKFTVLLPATIRFSALHVSVEATGKIKIVGSGTAKSFNSLANTSNSFSKSNTIKDAIFSNVTINKDNSVSFALSAFIDKAEIVYLAQTSATESVVSDELEMTTNTATSTTP